MFYAALVLFSISIIVPCLTIFTCSSSVFVLAFRAFFVLFLIDIYGHFRVVVKFYPCGNLM